MADLVGNAQVDTLNPAFWLVRAAHLYPDSPALMLGEEMIADYAGFARRAASIGASLRDHYDVMPGDRVAIFLPNCIEYLDILYGAWFAGAAVVPINAKLHAREAAWIVGNSAARVLITNTRSASDLIGLVDASKTLTLDSAGPEFAELYREPAMREPAQLRGGDLVWLFYTSGTTGRPKGVMISAGNVLAMTQSYFVDVDAVCHEDAFLYAAPMSHGAGLYNFMYVIRGARHVVPCSGGFDAAEIARLGGSVGNICMFAAPTMIHRLISHARESGYSGRGLKTIVYGGGPMYMADILEALRIFGPRFAQIYGQGECPMSITALSKNLIAADAHPLWRKRLGSVGVAQSSVAVKVVDDAGRERPRGVVGEIIVAGAPVMSGYWRDADASASTLRDGWLWTGDMGEMDADGFVTLRDRSKDVIISGGTNIYPREVEEVLLAHPSVAQVSVLGKADPEWGEIVVAFVTLKDGWQQDDDALDAHCVASIARFKRPKRYIYLADLPKNAYGKVLKTALRDQLLLLG